MPLLTRSSLALRIVFAALLLCLVPAAHAASFAAPDSTVTVLWNPNPEPDIRSYVVYYGQTSGSYDHSVDVDGSTTTATLTNLAVGTWYCAVQATNSVGLSSELSDEISFQIRSPVIDKIGISGRSADLLSGSSITLSQAPVGNASMSEMMTILNDSDHAITNLAINVNGGDFIASSLMKTRLAPGERTWFYVFFVPKDGGVRSGSVSITSTNASGSLFTMALSGTAIAPVVAVRGTDGQSLLSGVSAPGFGVTRISESLVPQCFTIANEGNAALTGLAVTVDGVAADDFLFAKPEETTLAPGASTRLFVLFRPTAIGTRLATLHITNQTVKTSSFDIPLFGTGVGVPKLSVFFGTGSLGSFQLPTSLGLGSAMIGSAAGSQPLTLQNIGTETLSLISATIDGPQANDFMLAAQPVAALAPNASQTLRIVFRPTAAGPRNAVLHLASNDPDRPIVNISLLATGVALPPKIVITAPTTRRRVVEPAMPVFETVNLPTAGFSASTAVAKPAATILATVTQGIEVIRGKKYRTLTIKGGSVSGRDVEVSSDLLTWSSGDRHTTVMAAAKGTLKVRDNTPISDSPKRYIRVRPGADRGSITRASL